MLEFCPNANACCSKYSLCNYDVLPEKEAFMLTIPKYTQACTSTQSQIKANQTKPKHKPKEQEETFT
jgi:hypothetical protein